MPRTVVRAPGHDRGRSLGWLAVSWMEFFCRHGPGDVQGQPVEHTDEDTEFIVDCYGLDQRGRLLYDSAFLSRPKGCDKSGKAARFSLFEALGPCRFTGWARGGEVYTDPWGLGFRYTYEPGEPMGRPVKVPYVRILATEEGQTGNVYDSVYFNLTDDDCPLASVPGVVPGLTRILLPGGGEITPSTASSAAKDGGKETFAAFDETHLYNHPELRRMYDTVTRNMRKRKRIAGTWYLETTTMFAAGEDSVAEATYKLAEQITDGKARRSRLLYDHRWGECDDLTAEDQLRAAILEAFGEAIEWNDVEAIIDEFYDTRKSPVDSRRYFLNAPSSAADAYLTQFEWAGCADPGQVVADRDAVTLGFDGSRGRARGKPDATALIGCRVTDGHLFELGVWEAPDGPGEQDWTPPMAEVEAAVASAFTRFRVAAFYCDPAKGWRSHVNAWEAKYGAKVAARASRDHPFEWWMTGGRSGLIQRAVEQFERAVRNQDLSHDGSYALTRHVLNARRRIRAQKLTLGKEHDYSPRKIDAAVAAVLAWQGRLDAVAKGVGSERRKSRRIVRH